MYIKNNIMYKAPISRGVDKFHYYQKSVYFSFSSAEHCPPAGGIWGSQRQRQETAGAAPERDWCEFMETQKLWITPSRHP